MKVHRRLRIPSERLSSLTRRMTRKSRKNVMDTDAFSESCIMKKEKETENLDKKENRKYASFQKGKCLTHRDGLHGVCVLHQ